MIIPNPVDIGLIIIVLAVLIGPFASKKIEHNLEVFLFAMGVFAVTIASFYTVDVLEALGYTEQQMELVGWNMEIIIEAIKEPIYKGIVPAVLIAGLIFFYGRSYAQNAMTSITKKVPVKIIVFLIVFILGLLSSVITAIIASLLLVELMNCIPFDRKTKINVIIIACFSIGLGAVLTPIGEPLSTIAITKLQGPPYYADFFYLFNQLAFYIIPGCLAMALLAMFFVGKKGLQEGAVVEDDAGTLRDVGVRALKVYVFVMALLLLGSGMKVLIDKYLLTVPAQILYWVNMISAILDNATLTAAELSPAMSQVQINAVLMGLLIAGGMLIPGNIPNIISAGKLGISSKEWARLGVPLGLVVMLIYFVWIFYTPFHYTFNLGG